MYSIRKNGKFVQWALWSDVIALANGRKLGYVRGAFVFGDYTAVRFD